MRFKKEYDAYGCTYVLYSTRDFRIMYVGATTSSLDKRLYDHLYKCEKTNPKATWIKRELQDGYEIRAKTVALYQDKQKLGEGERALYFRVKEKNPQLTNDREGGFSGFTIPQSQREYYRQLYKGKPLSQEHLLHLREYHATHVSPQKGVPLSLEHRKHLSEAKKGKPSNKKKGIEVYDVEGNYIRAFSSITEAAKELGVCISGIANCLTGRAQSCHKMKFKYTTE